MRLLLGRCRGRCCSIRLQILLTLETSDDLLSYLLCNLVDENGVHLVHGRSMIKGILDRILDDRLRLSQVCRHGKCSHSRSSGRAVL